MKIQKPDGRGGFYEIEYNPKSKKFSLSTAAMIGIFIYGII